jgi:hypothetical protein
MLLVIELHLLGFLHRFWGNWLIYKPGRSKRHISSFIKVLIAQPALHILPAFGVLQTIDNFKTGAVRDSCKVEMRTQRNRIQLKFTNILKSENVLVFL